MISGHFFRGGISAALLSDALWDCGGNLLSRAAAADQNRRSRLRIVILSAAAALPIATAAQQPMGPPGAYPAPYANPYAAPYGSAPQPYRPPPAYGYRAANGYAQTQYPQQPPQYAQQPYGNEQPQYAQQPYDEPGGDAQGYAGAGQQYAPQNYSEPQQDYGADQEQSQALDPSQLEQLLAPVALYPDALLAQVVTAATYPAQVAAADAWLDNLESQGGATPDQVVAGANAHTEWDPSIKSLTAFPQVLDMMARNLQWTTDLGNAYYNQPQDVMQTVQLLRQRAEDAGNLRSTPQEPLNYENGYIQLEPANQQTAYVPEYDPWSVYGDQISPFPGFSLVGALGSFFNSGLGQNAISYGLGIALSAFGHTPWGFLGWGLNWLANAVLFNHSDYFTHSTSVADWGLPHGGPRAYYGRWNSAHLAGGYGGRDRYIGNRGYNGFERGHSSGFANSGREFYGQRGEERFNPAYRGGENVFSSQSRGREAYRRPEAQNGGMQSYAGRPDQYRSSFDSGRRAVYGNGYQQGFASRPGAAFASPSREYGASRNYARGNGFDGRGYSGVGSYEKSQHSGGFHLFGHSRHSDSYGGGRASSGFFGGNHSSREFGRQSFGREKMPKMKMPKERSSWGGHSGGGHFGGGHSGHFHGGHSGGGHRSSGHHR